MSGLRLRVEGGRRFRAAAKALRQAGATDLRRSMVRQMKGAGEEILRDQRTEVQRLNITGRRFWRSVAPDGTVRESPARYRPNRRSTGLRQRVARTLALQVKASGKSPTVRFLARPERMPAGQQNLPRHLDNPKGWRHPVFGNREMWVSQVGGTWFWPPVKRKIRAFRARLDDAITETVNKIERG